MTTNSRDDTCGSRGYRYSERLPTNPGYYWARQIFGPPRETIVEVFEIDDELWVVYMGVSATLPNRLSKDLRREFAGPIVPPQD